MDWTKFTRGLKGIDRIECDVVPYNEEYAIKIVTPKFAIALLGFKSGDMPKQLEPVIRSCNMGQTKKAFGNQNEVKRPYELSRTPLVYDPGDKDDALYIFEGTHEKFESKKPFFIKKRYFDLIPGDIITLVAPGEDWGGVLFISTESYGYILPHKPNKAERESILDTAKLLKGVVQHGS